MEEHCADTYEVPHLDPVLLLLRALLSKQILVKQVLIYTKRGFVKWEFSSTPSRGSLNGSSATNPVHEGASLWSLVFYTIV